MAELRLSRDATLQGVATFLDTASAAQLSCKTKDNAAIAEALDSCSAELASQAAEIAQAVASASAGLLTSLEANTGLPEDQIMALNVALERCQQKSEVVPPKLATAKPGDKMYMGLVLKVKKVLSLDEEAWRKKLQTAMEEGLRSGGKDGALDVYRQTLKGECEEALWQAIGSHVQALGQSDHQPIYHTVCFSNKTTAEFMSWNTLEFPIIVQDNRYAAPDAVRNGTNPVCDALQLVLDRKGAEEKQLLLQALGAGPVIELHGALVLQEVQHALSERRVKAVLLQEVSRDMKARLLQFCEVNGWSVHFSTANDDPAKCDAITCVVSRETFDEVAEYQHVEGTKVRHFAAVRQGDTWIASCHVPGEVITKQQAKEGMLSHGNAVKATCVFRQIVSQFLNRSNASHFVVGGDWNTDVRILRDNLLAAPCCSRLDFHSPDGATCLDVEWPIDAVFLTHM